MVQGRGAVSSRRSRASACWSSGGGHTAIDCARSSVRLGAKAVEMVCLETKEAMTANPYEVGLGYTEEQARLEARRCYQCGFNVFIEAERCTLCNKCVEVCPQKCLEIIAFDRVENGDELAGMEIAREWLDGGAVFIDETLCTRCNKCVEVCPPQCMRMVSPLFHRRPTLPSLAKPDSTGRHRR